MRLHAEPCLKPFAVAGPPRNGDEAQRHPWCVDIAGRYDRLAPSYDAQAHRMRWMGFPEGRIHAEARRLLDAQPGERIVVVGGGTGRDVLPLAEAVGPTGTVWNVDISQGMLDACRAALEEAAPEGAPQVHLVHADAADWAWPAADAVLVSFTLLFQPRWRRVLQLAAASLGSEGRLVFCDLEMPWGVRHAAWPFVRGFGHSPTTLARRPAKALTQWRVDADRRFFFGLGRLVRARPPMP